MSPRPVIDAGPALNFLAVNQQRLLLQVLGKLSTPETVEAEVLRKARADRRFKGLDLTWSKLTPKWIEILSDDVTDELDSACRRITATGLVERKTRASDLGELMVIAHAVIEAEHRGATVTVVIDDRAGATLATAEAQRLNRLRAQGRPVGALLLVNTIGILQKGVIDGHIQNRGQMRMIYDRLYGCDDGLPPMNQTPLLSGGLWNSKEANRIHSGPS